MERVWLLAYGLVRLLPSFSHQNLAAGAAFAFALIVLGLSVALLSESVPA